MVVRTKTPDQTRGLGARLGRLLKGLDVVCLQGELGSGKTTLTQGLARGTGFSGRVTSPTFGLARVYRARRWMVYHLDLYRVAADETGDIGIEDYLGDPRGICVIEWPAAGRAYYPADRLEVNLSAVGSGRVSGGGRPGGSPAEGVAGAGRRISFKALGPRARQILRRLAP